MINRALQGFLTAHYGSRLWHEIRDMAGIPPEGFEAMLTYDHRQTTACFEAACLVLHKHPNALLEDLGTYLVTDPALEPLRRLLRFGGATFLDFLLSLEELRERGRLAIPDLELPEIFVTCLDPSSYHLRASWDLPGIAPILLGGLRAMADDYGALVLLSLDGFDSGQECLHVQLLDAQYAEGRQFVLGGTTP
ncbi:heme NO-binding domain-containing protein [Roseicyclus elongatus]|nr:heme NO-binding domain-containing protein [Roseibacterium elongatum]